MNKVILIGRLTRDPELRYTGSNKAVVNFSLAVSRTFASQNGEKETDFINIVAWEKKAETINNYLKQGSQISVEGHMQTRNYEDQSGKKIYVTEVVLENFQFLDSKGSNQNKSNNASNNVNPYTFTNENKDESKQEIKNDPFKDFGEEIKIEDDDLPF